LRTRYSRSRATLFALALLAGASAQGCGDDKPVGDAQKFHPNGIGIEAESRVIPARKS
jgi:hypothetical protein